MREFSIQNAVAMAKLLESRGLMTPKESGDFSVALNEIRDSVKKIFDDYLPRLVQELSFEHAGAADTVQDIREECSHIHYHVKDCKLPIEQDPWREILPKVEK
jgi:hypothetical protein